MGVYKLATAAKSPDHESCHQRPLLRLDAAPLKPAVQRFKIDPNLIKTSENKQLFLMAGFYRLIFP